MNCKSGMIIPGENMRCKWDHFHIRPYQFAQRGRMDPVTVDGMEFSLPTGHP